MELNKNNKLGIFTTVIALGFINQAHADGWGDAWHVVTGPVRVIAPAIEKGAQTLGKATADVVTLGGAGRDRDLAEAQKAKEVAEARRNAAETIRNQKISSIKLLIVHNNSEIRSTTRFIDLVVAIKKLIEADQKNITILIETYQKNKLEYNSLREVIVNQHEELVAWLNEIDKSVLNSQKANGNDDENGAIVNNENLTEKIRGYLDLIKGLSQEKASASQNQLDVPAFLSVNFQISLSLEKVLGKLKFNLESYTKNVENLESDLKTLESKGV